MLSTKLKTLLTVAEHLSFTKAAEQLSLTQPAVSHHISQIEEEFGVSLFIRSKNSLKVTSEGEIIIRYAKGMLALYNKAHMELKNAERQITKLTIGITHTAESNLMTEVLAKCSGESRAVHITIITQPINILYTMLESYEIDLAIVEGAAIGHDLSSLVLDTDFLVCAMSPINPLARNAMVTLDQLKKEKLILRLPTSATRILFDSTLRSLNDSPDEYNIMIELDNVATIKDLVRKNLGISVLPRSACLNELRKKKIVALPIENLSMVRETRIVYRKDFVHKEILQRITKVYQETAKEYR